MIEAAASPRRPVVTAATVDPEHVVAALPKRRVIDCLEFRDSEVPVEDLFYDGKLQIDPRIAREGYVTIGSKQDRMVLSAGPYVGLIPVNDRVAVNIKTGIPAGNVFRLLRIGGGETKTIEWFRQSYAFVDEPPPSLLDLFANALLAAVREIEVGGIHRAYERVLEDTSTPRGRLIVGDTLQRHYARGLEYQVVASWFEQTTDTGPNRLVKYALYALAMRYRQIDDSAGTTRRERNGAAEMLVRLNRAYHWFAGARLDHELRFRDDRLVRDPAKLPTIRAYYRPAIDVARTILHLRGLANDAGKDDLSLGSLAIRMSSVFENYLRTVLRTEMARVRPDIAVLDGNVAWNQERNDGASKDLFDPGATEKSVATPDIVLRSSRAKGKVIRAVLVIDTKYKRETGDKRPDLNQVIAYGLSYRANHVVLALPAPTRTDNSLRPAGAIGKLRVWRYFFDLEAPDIAEEERRFARNVAGLISVPLVADGGRHRDPVRARHGPHGLPTGAQ